MYHHFPLESLGPLIADSTDVVFLDTARPAGDQRYSLLFVRPLRVHICRALQEVPSFLETVYSEVNRGFWIAGYLTYEAGYGLEGRFMEKGRRTDHRKDLKDLAWFGVYTEPFIFDHCTGRWNCYPRIKKGTREKGDIQKGIGPLTVHSQIKHEGYTRKIRSIRRLIAKGDVYQVNYTFDASVHSTLEPWELYQSLRASQPVPFGAFIKTAGSIVASFSPELFLKIEGRRLAVQPMKGTASRGRFSEEDKELSRRLAHDEKNRSENIMIVDLLRNDLGKICETGSVKVSCLFQVERHPTVHQMTSSIKGRLRRGTNFREIIQATFPSGSVTGAPKIRAMEIIRELEAGQRGVYCGAIGYWSPSGKSVFSVPIRTLQKSRGAKNWRYRVGSGIVWDSTPNGEWRECREKCAFLLQKKPRFMLFESMLLSNKNVRFLIEHKKRLFGSAEYFDFPLDEEKWNAAIKEILQWKALPDKVYKIRIFLDKRGSFSWDGELIQKRGPQETARVVIARKPIAVDTPFLFHKTTYRPWYKAAAEQIHTGACFDVLHFNKQNQLTEGARSNLFILKQGTLFTSPVMCGLLPGVLRGRLLRAGKCAERILYRKDLYGADAVFCGNSVRGLVRVEVAGM